MTGWLAGLLCGALLALAPGCAAGLAALLTPGLLAWAIDRTHGRPAARAMLLFGAAGCAGALRDLWESFLQGDGPALSVLEQPDILAAAWLAAAGGWLLSQAAPVVARVVLDLASDARVARLKAERARHEEEWDLAAD